MSMSPLDLPWFDFYDELQPVFKVILFPVHVVMWLLVFLFIIIVFPLAWLSGKV